MWIFQAGDHDLPQDKKNNAYLKEYEVKWEDIIDWYSKTTQDILTINTYP